MTRLLRAAQILLLPLNLLASNQIFESGSRVKLAMTSDGGGEAFWLFDSSNHYFSHYPYQSAAAAGYLSYLEEGSFSISSLGNNRFSNQYSSTGYGMGYLPGTSTPFAGSSAISRSATVELTSPFTANYTGTRTDTGGTTDFYGNLIIYPAQDYAPNVLPVGSVWSNDGYYYKDPGLSFGDDYGTVYGNTYTIQSSNSLQLNDLDYGLANGSYTYTKLGPNLGSISLSSPLNSYSASLSLFFVSPTEVHYYGNTTDIWGNYTDWGTLSVNNPSNYSPPSIFSAPSTLPQNQTLQIIGTNSDLSLDLAGGTWTDANGGSGSFTYTYGVQSGCVAGLTLNRTIQNVPASPEHFALRFTDDGVGEVVYSSLDGSQSFNLVAAPTWELYDDFSGSTLDTQKWETTYFPRAFPPSISSGQLRLDTGYILSNNRKEASFYNILKQAGLGQKISQLGWHTGVVFTDPNIIGVEADLFLDFAGTSSPGSGVTIDLWEQVGPLEIRCTSLELGYWGGASNEGELWFNKSPYTNGSEGESSSMTNYVSVYESHRVSFVRKNGEIKLYQGDNLVQTHPAEGEIIGISIMAFNDQGLPMSSTVDNVNVLRSSAPPTPSLLVVESYGNTELLEDSSGYYAGSASTPLLYTGTQVSSTYPSATFSAAGVDEVNGSYRLVLTNGSLYYAANFSLSGSNTSTWAAVSDILAEEVNLQQDLDGDGHVGPPPIAPPASIAGKSFILTALTGELKTVPDQVTFTADTISFGFSGNLLEYLSDSYIYSNLNGTVIYDTEEVIKFTYTSSTGGTYEEGYDEGNGFSVENTGTFEEANISLSLQTNWQRSETMDSPVSTQYWQIGATSGDSVAYNDGELNFIFDSGSSDPAMGYYEDQEIEISYAGALPLDEDWQIVVDDTYVSGSVGQFSMGYQLELEGSFDCEFGFGDQGAGREVYFYADDGSDINYFSANQPSAADPRIQNGLNFRIKHLASSRELIYSYQPDGVSDWTELARINLSTGAASGLSGSGTLTGQLPSSSENLFFDVNIDKYSTEATPIENIEIGGIEIGSSAAPTPSLLVVESYGNTELLEDSSGYYAGSASTPLLYTGTQVSSTYPSATFSAAGVDEVNGSYRLVLTNGSLYYAANFSLSGSNTSTWAAVSDILAEEVNLQQDLDGDGHVGPPPIAPPASIAGKSFIVTPLSGEVISSPKQASVGTDTFSYGFSGNLLGSYTYSYLNGTVTFNDYERLDLTYTSATGGTYEEGEVGPDGTFYVENTGTFEEANISLSLQTNWQRTETMDSALSTQYWHIESTSGDSVAYNDGELNFIFDLSSSPDPFAANSEEQEIEVAYAGALPLDEDWQIVIDDTYVSDSVDQFAMGYQITFQRSFFCEFGFLDRTSGRGIYFYADSYNSDTNQTDYYGDYYGPVVSNIADPLIQNGLNFRIQHLSSTRELVYSYQPEDGVSDWTELARINLSTGAVTGLSGNGSLTGLLPSSSENLFFGVDIDKYSAGAIPIENIEIGGIEIGSYTPPVIPVDTDGDGLYDSVETNTGVYVSPSDTGTDPNNADTSGDGFTDAEAISASVDPNFDYGGLLSIVRQNPDRFDIFNNQPDPGSIVDMQMGSVGLERGADGNFDMNFDLEISTDLQTWTPHASHTFEISVPDQSKTFMRLNVK